MQLEVRVLYCQLLFMTKKYISLFTSELFNLIHSSSFKKMTTRNTFYDPSQAIYFLVTPIPFE